MQQTYRFVSVLIVILFLAGLSCAQSEKKAAYAIFLDNSASLTLRLDQVQTLGKGLAHYILRSSSDDSISLFNFKTQTSDKNKNRLAILNPGVDWSRNEKLLNSYIDNLSIEVGDTSLLDAIHSIAEKLNTKAALDKTISSKVIVLVTDGEEVKSRIKESQLIKVLKDGSIQVYAIGIDNGFGERGGETLISPKEKAENRLKKITKETGGRVVFLNATTSNSVEVLRSLFEGTNKK